MEAVPAFRNLLRGALKNPTSDLDFATLISRRLNPYSPGSTRNA